MAETTTTTTTQVETTTTTTEVPKVDPAPTGDKASVNHPGGMASPNAERQGEVQVDKGAKTDVVGGTGKSDPKKDAEVQAQNLEQAKQDGLRNATLDESRQPTKDSAQA